MMSHYQRKLFDLMNTKQIDRGMDPFTETSFIRNYPTDEIAEREYRIWKPSGSREKYVDVDMMMDNSGVGRRKKRNKPKTKRCRCK